MAGWLVGGEVVRGSSATRPSPIIMSIVLLYYVYKYSKHGLAIGVMMGQAGQGRAVGCAVSGQAWHVGVRRCRQSSQGCCGWRQVEGRVSKVNEPTNRVRVQSRGAGRLVSKEGRLVPGLQARQDSALYVNLWRGLRPLAGTVEAVVRRVAARCQPVTADGDEGMVMMVVRPHCGSWLHWTGLAGPRSVVRPSYV